MASPTRITISSSRFEPTWDGFCEYRHKSGKPFSDGTKKKWKPIIVRVEELRIAILKGVSWQECEPENIAYDLYQALLAEVRGRGGNEPSSNTLRGRYDACKGYFDFLVLTDRLPSNPMSFLQRPSSKATQKPFLAADEDAKLASVEKAGHEIAIYALGRGAALREGEICDLCDEDVDLKNGSITVRDGKTRAATRTVPIFATTVLLLAQYRAWRDKHCPGDSNRFVRTRSGSISKGYVWKLVKAMARRAGVGIVLDENGEHLLDPNNNVLTKVTPHALRRTFGADLVRRGVATVTFSPILGHASPRVTEESYSPLTLEDRARKVLHVAGEGPFSLAGNVSTLEAQLESVCERADADPAAALAQLRILRETTEMMERKLNELLDAA